MDQKKKIKKYPQNTKVFKNSITKTIGIRAVNLGRLGWGKISKAEHIQLNQAGQKHRKYNCNIGNMSETVRITS